MIVVGWMFDQFADPIRRARLAAKIGLAENVFWLAGRGIDPEKLPHLFEPILESRLYPLKITQKIAIDLFNAAH